MVPRLLEIWRIECRSSRFLVWMEITVSCKLFPNNDNHQFKLKFGTKTSSISKYRWWYSVSPFLTGNTLLGQLWSKKIKIVSLNWNLVPRLIPISKIWWRIQCSLFLCQTKNTLFRQIRSKKKELSVQAEIWYLDYFE